MSGNHFIPIAPCDRTTDLKTANTTRSAVLSRGSAKQWLLMSATTIASPFVFTFQTPITDKQVGQGPGAAPVPPTIPGVSVGDILILQVFADNGNNSLISQIWNRTEVIVATINVGTYWATFLPPLELYGSVFRTDNEGALSFAHFADVDSGYGEVTYHSNTDKFGIGPSLTVNAIAASSGGHAFFSQVTQGFPSLWSVSSLSIQSQIPEPSLISVLSIALVGLLAYSRCALRGSERTL